MDTEIYEPLNQFDADLRDLMMDCITEKDSNVTSVNSFIHFLLSKGRLSQKKMKGFERLHKRTEETLQVCVFPCFSFLLCFELGAEKQMRFMQVRRILSLDPSKYKNGRLPFGLKPDKGVALTEGADLEEKRRNDKKSLQNLSTIFVLLGGSHLLGVRSVTGRGGETS